DWLSEKGTELLQAQEAHLDELHGNMLHMADLLESQFKNSITYQKISETYLSIEFSLDVANDALATTNKSYERDIVTREQLLQELSAKSQQYQDKQQELDVLMDSMNIKGWSV
ncbi:hypothetical protein, partial [Shewanella sp.]